MSRLFWDFFRRDTLISASNACAILIVQRIVMENGRIACFMYGEYGFFRQPAALCAFRRPFYFYVRNSFGVLMPTHCPLRFICFVVNYSKTLSKISIIGHRVRFGWKRIEAGFNRMLALFYVLLYEAVFENVHHITRNSEYLNSA